MLYLLFIRMNVSANRIRFAGSNFTDSSVGHKGAGKLVVQSFAVCLSAASVTLKLLFQGRKIDGLYNVNSLVFSMMNKDRVPVLLLARSNATHYGHPRAGPTRYIGGS